MRTKSKVILIVVGSIVLITICATFGFLLFQLFTGRLFGYEPPPMPAQLKEPRIIIGKDFLSRSVFFQPGFLESAKGIGSFSDVAVGEFDSRAGIDVVLAGRKGAIIFDQNGTNVSLTLFTFKSSDRKIGPFTTETVDTALGDIQVIDLERDGTCEYLARGSIDGAAIFNHHGKLLWTYGKYEKNKLGINNLTTGDLDGDGVAEFVVSWDGIEVFDKSGKRRAKVEEEYGASQIEIVDTNGDGQNEIVSVAASLKIRDAQGRPIKEIDIPMYLGTFAISNMPGRKEPLVLGIQDKSLWLFDFQGNTVAQFSAPMTEFDDTTQQTPFGEIKGTGVYRAKGIWIKLASDQPEYLAVINEFAALDRSVLDVYTSSGELVYEEVLPETCLAIAALPPAHPAAAPEFLVSGERTVWRYRVK